MLLRGGTYMHTAAGYKISISPHYSTDWQAAFYLDGGDALVWWNIITPPPARLRWTPLLLTPYSAGVCADRALLCVAHVVYTSSRLSRRVFAYVCTGGLWGHQFSLRDHCRLCGWDAAGAWCIPWFDLSSAIQQLDVEPIFSKMRHINSTQPAMEWKEVRAIRGARRSGNGLSKREAITMLNVNESLFAAPICKNMVHLKFI